MKDYRVLQYVDGEVRYNDFYQNKELDDLCDAYDELLGCAFDSYEIYEVDEDGCEDIAKKVAARKYEGSCVTLKLFERK